MTTPFTATSSDTPTADAFEHLMQRFGDYEAQALLDILDTKQLGLIRRGECVRFLANRAWNGASYASLVRTAQVMR